MKVLALRSEDQVTWLRDGRALFDEVDFRLHDGMLSPEECSLRWWGVPRL